MSVITAHSASSLLSIVQGDCVREIHCCGKLAAVALVATVFNAGLCPFDQGVTQTVAHTGHPAVTSKCLIAEIPALL